MPDHKSEIIYLQKKLQLTNQLLLQQYAKFCASQKKQDLDTYVRIDYELLLLRRKKRQELLLRKQQNQAIKRKKLNMAQMDRMRNKLLFQQQRQLE